MNKYSNKYLLVAFAIAAFGLASPANAADLRAKAPVYKAPIAIVAYNWTGFHVGGHAGYTWMNSTDEITAVAGNALGFINGGDVASSIPLNPNGFIGGAQIGYNWQPLGSQFVYGFEADISWTDLDKTVSAPGPTDASRIMTANQKMDWFGTVRGRLGYTPMDRLLAYATGGLAFGHGSLSTALTRDTGCGGLNNCQQGSTSGTKAGWTAGGGLEWAFANNWSAKAEYLYFDLGSLSHQMTDPFFPATIFNASAKFRGSIARVGLNYQFH
jgi:outer membrane immunogenic protein